MSSRCGCADSFAETLSAMIRQHCDRFLQQEYEELARLRTEEIQWRDKVTSLNQQLALLKDVEANKSTPTAVVNDEQEDRADTEHADARKTSEMIEFHSSKTSDDLSQLEGSPFGRQASVLQDLETTGTTAVMLDLQKKFSDLDPQRKGYIDIGEVVNHMTQHLTSKKEREEQMHRYRYAVHRLNRTIGMLVHSLEDQNKLIKGDILFATFEVIMIEKVSVLQDQFGKGVTNALLDMRESLVDEVIVEKLARTFHVSESDIDGLKRQELRRTDFEKYLEPLSGLMIMLNAFVIGFSLDTDPDWKGWYVLECFFTVFFVVEFGLNVYIHSCIEHFFGADWCLNWFDFVVVWSAVLDNFLSALERLQVSESGGGNSYHLLLLRLVRLLRITRILRVLRLKLFKDLTLMVNGVIYGLRTLFWAIVLLTFLLYVLGVFMRQVVDPENRTSQCDSNSRGSARECNRGQENMDEFGEIMFGSVFRSMLTMFTCFTEGCISPDGTPFIWHLWDTHGPLLVVGYVASFVFITFGVFNLIMAVMVQNTLENAAQLDAERQFGEESGQAKKAHKLHVLVGKLCRVQASPSARTLTATSRKGLRKLFEEISDGLRKSSNSVKEAPVEHSKHLHLRINHDQFDDMMRDREVKQLFDDLDISGISRGQLFDILDADGTGFLSVSEMVDGLMKLRGPADKGDVIAAGLRVRQLQKQVRSGRRRSWSFLHLHLLQRSFPQT